MDLLKEKEYPYSYPKDAVRVLNAMVFPKAQLKIMGSASLVSQRYTGDYDGYEIAEGSPDELAKYFQSTIRRLQKIPNTYIGDIKCGIIEEWRVLPPDTKNLAHTQKVDSLFASKIISADEAKLALSLLSTKPSKVNVLKAQKELKFHIIRWTPKQVLTGYQTLRDGRKYTLQEAIQSPTITKIDVISLVNGKYTDFSVIYEFRHNGKALNPDIIDPEKSIKNDITLYQAEGNRFKVIKRKFALAKLKNQPLEKYHKLLNSELGKIYVLYSDVKTVADLLEMARLPATKARDIIQGFRYRIKNIYSSDDDLQAQKLLLSELDEAKADPTILRQIEAKLLAFLSAKTKLRGGILFPYLEG